MNRKTHCQASLLGKSFNHHHTPFYRWEWYAPIAKGVDMPSHIMPLFYSRKTIHQYVGSQNNQRPFAGTISQNVNWINSLIR